MNDNIKLRKSFLGGFRKKDVMRYVEQLNSENEELISQLQMQVDGRSAVSVSDTAENEQKMKIFEKRNEELALSVAELTEKLKTAQEQLEESKTEIKKLESEKEYAFSTVASTQAELIRTKEIARQNAVIVVEQTDGSRDVLSLDELLQELRSYRIVASTLRENCRKLSDSLNKQMDFADSCIESLTNTKK